MKFENLKLTLSTHNICNFNIDLSVSPPFYLHHGNPFHITHCALNCDFSAIAGFYLKRRFVYKFNRMWSIFSYSLFLISVLFDEWNEMNDYREWLARLTRSMSSARKEISNPKVLPAVLLKIISDSQYCF